MTEIEVIADLSTAIKELLWLNAGCFLVIGCILGYVCAKLFIVNKYCMWLVSQKHLELKLKKADNFSNYIHTKEPF